jgi:hypothetical protein
MASWTSSIGAGQQITVFVQVADHAVGGVPDLLT